MSKASRLIIELNKHPGLLWSRLIGLMSRREEFTKNRNRWIYLVAYIWTTAFQPQWNNFQLCCFCLLWLICRSHPCNSYTIKCQCLSPGVYSKVSQCKCMQIWQNIMWYDSKRVFQEHILDKGTLKILDIFLNQTTPWRMGCFWMMVLSKKLIVRNL